MERKIAMDDAIAHFPASIQSQLRQLAEGRGVVPSETVAQWLQVMNIEIGHLMIALLPYAASYARVPISHYHVGAVALGMPPTPPVSGPGNLYLGANMEFRGQAISFCVHGEQSATNNAWLHGETGLQALAINAAPCGYCRQFLYELTSATNGLNILLKANTRHDNYDYTANPLTYYLPDAFGPGDLGITGGLMDPDAHGLTIASSDPAALTALDGANGCYAPYTSDFAGVAIVNNNGKVFGGRYAENAAYNPSMSPLESALAFMNMNSPLQAPYIIARTILVEAQADISQRGATETVLAAVAPAVKLEYLTAMSQGG